MHRALKKYVPELLLGGIVLLTRIPFLTKYLYNWDSVQLALALHYFDLAHHQPHPPGYILTIASAKFFTLFLHDDNAALCAVSICASIILVLLSYRFILLLFTSRINAFLFACIIAFNPFIWFHGEVALTYIFDALFSILFGYFAIATIKNKNSNSLFLFSFFLGLSGGFRETIILFYIPLWILTLFLFFKDKQNPFEFQNFLRRYLFVKPFGVRRHETEEIFSRKLSVSDKEMPKGRSFGIQRDLFKKIFPHFLLFLFGITIWCIPLFILSGGVQKYLSLNTSYFTFTAQRTSLLLGVPLASAFAQIKNVVSVTGALLHILIIIPLFFIFPKVRKTISTLLLPPPLLLWVLIIWLMPSYLFYLFIHFGNMGYLMTGAIPLLFLFLLPLLLLTHTQWRTVSFCCMTGIIAIQFFHFSVAYRIPQKIKKIIPSWTLLTHTALQHHDTIFKEYIDATRGFNPQTTLLITESGFYYRHEKKSASLRNTLEFFRHAQYYLPEYRLYQLVWDHAQGVFFTYNQAPFTVVRENLIHIDPIIQKIVIFADGIDNDDLMQNTIRELPLTSGKKLFILDMNEKKSISYSGYVFTK